MSGRLWTYAGVAALLAGAVAYARQTAKDARARREFEARAPRTAARYGLMEPVLRRVPPARVRLSETPHIRAVREAFVESEVSAHFREAA